MSNVLDSHVSLRKRSWFHFPSFAVVIAAASLVYIGDRAADTWTATVKKQRPEERAIEAIGTAQRRNIKPTHTTWSVTIDVKSKQEATAARELTARRDKLLAILDEAGLSRSDIRINTPTVEEATRTVTRTALDGNTFDEDLPDGFAGSQAFEIRSKNIATATAANTALANAADYTVFVDRPTCWLDNTDPLSRELQKEALADARAKADQIVATLGHARLGALVAVEPTYGLSISDRGHPETCTEGATATVSIKATYKLR